MRRGVCLGFAAVLVLAPAAAVAEDWYDSFEDYPVDQQVAGQGIWQTWSGGTGTTEDAYVSDEQAATGTNSLAIVSLNDVVATFDGITEGVWLVKAKAYVPSDQQGELSFIMTNTFPASVFEDWSVQVTMSASTGVISDYYTGNNLALVTDDWAEITVEIDLNHNLHTISYNGIPLSLSTPWSAAGRLSFRAIDLYAESTTECYYDDLSVEKVCVPVEVERTVDPGSTAVIEGVDTPAYVEGDPLFVTLTLSNIREDDPDCPELGDVTITETLPDGWTAMDISDGGTFADGAVTWVIPAAALEEGELSYQASGPVRFADVPIVGTIAEEGNKHFTHVRGSPIPAAEGAILSDGAITRWLILGPYIQNVVTTASGGTASLLEQDFLSDGIDIFEETVRPREGDEVDTDYGLPVSAALRLAGAADGATRADLNPGGTPTWFAWRDLDSQISFDNVNMFGGGVDNCMAYAVCYLDVQEDLSGVYFSCGSDDAIALVLDGEPIWANPVLRSWTGFIDIVGPFDLDEGVHVLMAKAFEAGGGWNFGVRIQTKTGAPLLDGYCVTLDPDGCEILPEILFIRGDTDGNGSYTIGDGVQILERLFANRAAYTSDCEETGDVDGNGVLTIGDAVWLFNYLFASSAPPAEPAGACGTAELKIGCNAGIVEACQ
ncbi:MAG: hypothetical protein JXP34_15895 [Planctomycetes bacterium]|nr:hypothetical protein [Planctomycetota bacterium]